MLRASDASHAAAAMRGMQLEAPSLVLSEGQTKRALDGLSHSLSATKKVRGLAPVPRRPWMPRRRGAVSETRAPFAAHSRFPRPPVSARR